MFSIIKKVINTYFYHLYHSFAWSYNLVAMAVSSGNWFDWVKMIIEFINENDVILEVGFGTGILHDELLKNNFNVFGIDESRQMNKICKKRNKNQLAKLKIVRGLVNSLPYADQQFDKIISTFPSEYIYDTKFLDELNRVLKFDGEFIALTSVRFLGKSIFDVINSILFKATNEHLNSIIEHKLEDCWNLRNKFSYKFHFRNCKGVQLTFIVLSR